MDTNKNCTTCNHKCHCASKSCLECVNDVCYVCMCEESLSEKKDANEKR